MHRIIDAMKIAAIAHLFLCFVMGKDTDPLQKLHLQLLFFSSLVVITDYIPSGKKNSRMNSLMLRKAIAMRVCTCLLFQPFSPAICTCICWTCNFFQPLLTWWMTQNKSSLTITGLVSHREITPTSNIDTPISILSRHSTEFDSLFHNCSIAGRLPQKVFM